MGAWRCTNKKKELKHGFNVVKIKNQKQNKNIKFEHLFFSSVFFLSFFSYSFNINFVVSLCVIQEELRGGRGNVKFSFSLLKVATFIFSYFKFRFLAVF